MINFYALATLSPTALAKADELGVDSTSYNYKGLSDPRREGRYLYVTVEDDEVLHSRFLKADEIEFLDKVDITVVK